MKKLLSIFGAFGLITTSTASSMSVVSCANPVIAHNNYGKIQVSAEMFENAITNLEKYNTTKGQFIYNYVKDGAGMNISKADLDNFTATGKLELTDNYKNLIIDHFGTTLEELALIPVNFGIDYTMFTFDNWTPSVGNVYGKEANVYSVDVTYKGTDLSTTLTGVFFHKDVITQTKMDQASFETSIDEYNRVTNGSTMMTDVDPKGYGFFIALEFTGQKTEDGRFNTPNTTSLKDLEQKNVDFMAMVMREYGIFDQTMQPLRDYFDVAWEEAIGSLNITSIDGETITSDVWDGNSKFGKPLEISFVNSNVTWKDGGSYLCAGVYDFV